MNSALLMSAVHVSNKKSHNSKPSTPLWRTRRTICGILSSCSLKKVALLLKHRHGYLTSNTWPLAVLSLLYIVEENNNDFSCLPYARLRSTRSLSLVPQQTTPIAGPSRITQFQSQSNSNHSQSYAPSIVAELSRQLEVERVAHAQTTAQAENNIALLECAVARRDAEIEKWITKTSDIHASTPIEKDSITPLKRLTEISQEGMRRIDALSQERQDLLENELAVLKGKVIALGSLLVSLLTHYSL